jgi:MFS family permease
VKDYRRNAATTTIDNVSSPLSEADHRAQLRRALIASTVGTTIEWYDFFLYGQATGLFFGKLFFPRSDPLVGVLQAFAIYAVGFVARPIGAAIFGHYGDRIGRKAALITTLLMTGLATFAVGFVPTYEQIGIWGAVILTIIRFIQGLGLGGEWGGSVLLSMEWARSNAHRGFIASWPQFGAPAGFLANLVVLVFSAISGDQFLSWGWRVPFFVSIIMVGVGLYIRLGILETPTFSRLLAENRIERAPVLEVIKRQPKSIILVALAKMGEMAPAYVYSVFVLTYGTTVLGSSRDLLLSALVASAAMSFFTVPIAGYLSDRIGRKRTYLIGSVATGVFGFIYFALLNTRMPSWIFIAIVFSFVPHDLMYGPQAALIAECFTPPPALQRRLARLPALLGHRRRPSAADRDRAARGIRVGVCDRRLHPFLCDRQRDRDGLSARLHQPRHFGGVRLAIAPYMPAPNTQSPRR